MKTKIENQEQYEAQIEYFKEKYITEFKAKINVPGCNKIYVRDRFKRGILEPRINEIFNTENINEPHHFRNQKEWVNGIETFDAVRQFCEEKKIETDFQLILQSLAEHDAILVIFNVLNIDEGPNQAEPEKMEKQVGNDKLHSIIENNFAPFKVAFNNEKDYFEAVHFLRKFFLSEQINIAEPLFVKNGNIRSMAFTLGEIWRSQKNESITYEYLSLYKQLFSIFKKQIIERDNIFGSNLYKYSISKT